MKNPGPKKKDDLTEKDHAALVEQAQARYAADALAQAAVGATVEDRLRWVIRFVESDPSRFTPAEGIQLLALATPAGFIKGSRPAAGTLVQHVIPGYPPAMTDVRKVWRALRKGMDALTAGHALPWKLPPPILSPSVVRGGPIVMTPVYVTRGLVDAVLVEVARLLQAMPAGRLRVCRSCKRLLVAVGRQLRHPKCSQDARTATYRAKHRKG
jgi:hypothetical protein